MEQMLRTRDDTLRDREEEVKQGQSPRRGLRQTPLGRARPEGTQHEIGGGEQTP